MNVPRPDLVPLPPLAGGRLDLRAAPLPPVLSREFLRDLVIAFGKDAVVLFQRSLPKRNGSEGDRGGRLGT